MDSKLFYDLVQVAVGAKERLGRCPSKTEWDELFSLSKKQSVVGIMLSGIERLPEEQKPPQTLLLQWIGMAEIVRKQNALLNRRCIEVTKLFADAGFRSCILKGQGNAMMYPDASIRQPGDIDLWVDGNRKAIKEFVRSKCPKSQDGTLHIDFPYFKDVVVEVHYTPRYSNIPKYDKRLQEWFKNEAKVQFSNEVSLPGYPEDKACVPTTLFNAVHQMSHIMGHFFVEGIGLRQFIDYFYVLKRLHKEGCTVNFEELFDHLGMLKFARGVMWIEKEILGLEAGSLLLAPDERIGRVILEELEEGGNFGIHDERYSARKHGYLMRGITDTYRLLKLTRYFPKESLWKIVRKVENQKWKVRDV